MIAKSSDLIYTTIISGPHTYEEVKNKPGVYRLRNSDPNVGSAVMVVMKDNRHLYVNEGMIKDFHEVIQNLEACKFWTANHEIPDEITK